VIRERAQRPTEDVYLVFTTNEEIGGVGGSYASAGLPGTLTLALEVGRTEQEYGTSVSGVRSSATATPRVSTTGTLPTG
jgi:putative aminopeptidase FrvX